MVLHDFQRGRLPYFVPPKSDIDNKVDNDKEKLPEENSQEAVPHVTQDFESLEVVPDFKGEDMDIENDTAKDNVKNSFENVDSDNMEDEDDSEVEEKLDNEQDVDGLIDSSLLETLSTEEKKFLRIKESSTSKGIIF